MEALALIAEMSSAAEGGWLASWPPPLRRRRTAPASPPPVELPLRLGTRTLLTLRRRLVRRPFGLAEAMATRLPVFPAVPEGAHGYFLTSVPIRLLDALRGARPELAAFVRQSYRRSFAAFDGRYEDWLAGLSAKSRSTLKRKLRRFAERSGGAIDLRRYKRPEAMADFYRYARRVSALSYQERRLGCGLPEGPEMRAELRERAARDAVRGWVLFLDGAPVSYLYAPAEGDVLVYSHLGYDPAAAALSPGTVLQALAMRDLFEERRFRLFDFTEGEGRHKRMFATGDIACADLLLLRRTLGNLAAGHALGAFDAAVAGAKKTARALRLDSLAAAMRR